MGNVLTFIVPIRHQDNARDWTKVRANLIQTLASIAAQTHPAWRAVVVANREADLPPLPSGVEVVHVDFPPNTEHEREGMNYEEFLDSFRIDKGRRVLAGMLSARDTRFFMIVDDDDFVSKRLVQFASENMDANGWFIRDGYVWEDRGRLLFIDDDFSGHCGSSLIIRSDLYALPHSQSAASEDYIKSMLGGHRQISGILKQRKTPLAPLPLRGAVYRIGNPVSHSRKTSIVNMFFLDRCFRGRPRRLLLNLTRFRIVTQAFKREFFGG